MWRQIGTGADETLLVHLHATISEPAGIWIGADEQEYAPDRFRGLPVGGSDRYNILIDRPICLG